LASSLGCDDSLQLVDDGSTRDIGQRADAGDAVVDARATDQSEERRDAAVDHSETRRDLEVDRGEIADSSLDQRPPDLPADTSTDGPPTDCSGFVGQATPAQTAQTPRTDTEAEQLAIEATGVVVAVQAVYDRVTAELARLRAGYPQVALIAARPSWIPSQLEVKVDASIVQAVQNDTYTGWACPNALYQVTAINKSLLGSLSLVLLQFDGNYNTPSLVSDYVAIAEVVSASPNYSMGDGNDLCLEVDGKTHHYIFDAGSGDCPAGCISHTYWGFSIDDAGDVTYHGTFSRSANPPPAWYSQRAECTKWL
jgi:hypothetical protein